MWSFNPFFFLEFFFFPLFFGFYLTPTVYVLEMNREKRSRREKKGRYYAEKGEHEERSKGESENNERRVNHHVLNEDVNLWTSLHCLTETTQWCWRKGPGWMWTRRIIKLLRLLERYIFSSSHQRVTGRRTWEGARGWGGGEYVYMYYSTYMFRR